MDSVVTLLRLNSFQVTVINCTGRNSNLDLYKLMSGYPPELWGKTQPERFVVVVEVIFDRRKETLFQFLYHPPSGILFPTLTNKYLFVGKKMRQLCQTAVKEVVDGTETTTAARKFMNNLLCHLIVDEDNPKLRFGGTIVVNKMYFVSLIDDDEKQSANSCVLTQIPDR